MAPMIRSVALAVLATIASLAFASGETYTVTATLLHNGKAFGKPSVAVKSDTPASLEVSGPDGYKLWLTVSDLASDKIQVSAKLDSSHGGMEPVLVVRPAEPATITVGELGLTITVVRGRKNSGAKADGIKVRFKIEEQRAANGAIETSSYENAYLFGFDEAAVADFKDITRIGFTAKDQGAEALLDVSLYDYLDGEAALVGEKQLRVTFDESSTTRWVGTNGMTYVLRMSPQRAPLPDK